MTFRITCPVCGSRDIYEFTFGGHERGPRPAQEGLAAEDHFRWAQFRTTGSEAQEEWWYHGAGCGVWFSTWRNPATNREETPPAGSSSGEPQGVDETPADDETPVDDEMPADDEATAD